MLFKSKFLEYTLQWRNEQLCLIDTASFAQLKEESLLFKGKLIKKRITVYNLETFEIVITKLVFFGAFLLWNDTHTMRYLLYENSLAPFIITILFFNIATSCNGGRNEQLFA